MIIGIDGSRAFIKKRTGIEEYSYQVIKHLRGKLSDARVVLCLRPSQKVDFDLPENWKIKIIKFPYLWTQLGLSLEMLSYPVDVLFIPAHTVPIVHPKNTIVTVHGLEYEFCPEAYSFWEKLYMRWSIKNSCKWASRIIAVSDNTKKDLMNLYKVPEGKIRVIYEGYEDKLITNNLQLTTKIRKPYLLFIGRLEERKNIIGIIKAFEVLKEHYEIPHKLILAGKPGFGYVKITNNLQRTTHDKDIVLLGYVSEEEKWELLKGADVFLFPTFYEGFGIPVLEAQSMGVPVVAGNNSSIPEIVVPKTGFSENLKPGFRKDASSVLLVDPMNAEQIADAAYRLISDKALRDDIIKKGYENIKRFSWDKCSSEIVKLINS